MPWEDGRVAPDVEAVLAALPILYGLELRGARLGECGAQQLAAALETAPDLRLTAADLADNRLGDAGAACVARALLCPTGRRASEVRYLDLSWNGIDARGARSLMVALVSPTCSLSMLDLECNDLQDDGVALLAEALPACKALGSLRLGANRIGAAGASSLAASLPISHLSSLELDRNYLGARGAGSLAAALQQARPVAANGTGAPGFRLRSLNVAVNRLGDAGAAALAKALPYASTLEELDLGSNFIGDNGVRALAEVLATDAPLLRWLGLSRNKISPEGGEALTAAVEAGQNEALQTVELGGNEDIANHVKDRIRTALQRNCRSLVLFDRLRAALENCRAGAYDLDLGGVEMGPEGGTRLAEALVGARVRVARLALGRAGLSDAGAESIAVALLRQARLRGGRGTVEELDLSWNGIRQPSSAQLSEALFTPGLSSVTTLDLDCNDLGDDGVRALFTALPALAGPSEGLAAELPANLEGTAPCPLRTLRLGGNSLGPGAAERLAEVLARTDVSIMELELGRNRLGPRGARALALALALPGCPLRALGLAVNRLGDDGATALAEGITTRGSRNGLALSLCLRGNLIRDAGAEALAEALASGKGLLSVSLEHNQISGPS